jgi:DNA-directed RNA polymerase specialized sigma24 family protein
MRTGYGAPWPSARQVDLTDRAVSGLLDTVNDASGSPEGLSESAASNDPEQGLAAVRALRALADRLEAVQVRNARHQGWSWQAIADVLQVSRQAVHQKHSRE